MIGAVLWVRRRMKAQAEAAASEAPPKPSAYAPAIPQPWSAHPGQGVGIPEPSGLYPTHSTDPMLPGLGSPGLSRACSTEPMLHHLGGRVGSLTSACSMDMKLPVRPGRGRAAVGTGQEPGSSGLYQTHSAEPMLPGRTSSDMSRMYSAGELCPCSTPRTAHLCSYIRRPHCKLCLMLLHALFQHKHQLQLWRQDVRQ